ncbi:MAG: hypothetical protein KF696_08180 [Planctomycetes bacterium]|nr:hypothetical protein [Planctomycetota bacterium]MCW8135672.1 hypothetical protein [Planctomycetota bacterium]
MAKAVLLLLVFASALNAATFDLSRVLPAADDELGFDIKPPWGLWGNRAPYPFYDGPFGIDTDDDLVARDFWIDFQSELWLTPSRYRGASGQIRARFGLFFADVGYTQITRTDGEGFIGKRKVKDWSYITDARGHLGVTIPIPILGYADFGIGLAGFDETPGISRVGASFKAALQIWPIFPVGVEAFAVREQFFDGTGVNDFGVKLHVQVFRHLMITAGWRWLEVDGTRFGTHGFTFGFSFQFSNLRTFFWAPFRGPAY